MSNAGEEKSDGLEIISIGKLYAGAWERKYWSSSRGKDRYPYPVGFKAVRTQNGVTYRMEICEGVKGPLFTISSNDGLSCSGQTPDIAWDSFQKKSCSRVKFWHGKRFSCTIDGIEFFGFKNAFVQRLLRELVANVGGTAEQNLLLSGFCNEASETRVPIQLTEFSLDNDMLPDLAKPRVTGKRSRKEKIIKLVSKSETDLKRVRTQNRDHDADPSSCGMMSQADNNDRFSSIIPTSQEENEGSLLRSTKLESMIEEEELLASVRDHLPSNSFDASDHFTVDDDFPQEQSKPVNSGSSTSIGHEGNLPKNSESLDRSKISVVPLFNCSIREDEEGESICPKTFHDSELCVPDTLDNPPGYSSNSFPHQVNKEVHTEDSCKLEDVIATDLAIPEVLATESESLREDEMGTSNSNASSEKGDSDSVGQEIAKSMMTVLLPRALPLLKTFSRKKKKNVKPSEMSTHITMAEHDKIDKVASPVRELKENPELDQNKKASVSVRNHEDDCCIKSVVPDSFDCDESGNLAYKKLCLLETSDRKTSIHCKTELLLEHGIDECNDSSSKTSLGFTFPSKKDTFRNVSKNSLCAVKQPAEDDTKTFPDYSEDILDPTTSFLDQELADFDMPTPSSLIQRVSCSDDVAQKQEVKDSSKVNNSGTWKHNAKLQDVLKLVACYVHPMPILALLLSTVGDKIYVCVICGSLAREDKVLFIYNAPVTGEKTGYPSFVGHASVILPMSEDALGSNQIAVDSSGLQFTPDGQSLVLLNSIKMPCCREGNIHCPCPSCCLDFFERNAVKIVHVKVGYVSVVNKLKTAQNVRCILVCEPNHLVAAENNGKIYLWVMDSTWSSQMEECHLPVPENWTSLTELKKIPNSASLIIGHNGFGEFSLWDIQKRILVSKFSAPSTTISKCVPISLFQWQRKGTVPPHSNQAELINEVLDATKMWFSRGDSELVQPIDSEDLAIWLIISTVSHPEFQCGYQSGDWEMDSAGSWRLALLVKNMVVIGSPLDLRASATGASVGHGIIGRSDGLVYMWELSTGIKVSNLYQFKGSGVSCIATDNSTSGALAVASDGGELLVYTYR
ncbi:hypothetical protein ACH5RR_030425 [Cinchona calisaya]|uniref:DNA binding protein n=1 Tax=Cinchona calisaya TaxID=153742 RepID=A0ABD2YVX2_9GENT